MKRFSILIISIQLCIISILLPAQGAFLGLVEPVETDPSERILLAISNSEYPVTPGDTYQLTYQPTEDIITLLISVEIDYSLNLGVLGKVNGEGLTFPEIKKRIEKKFSAAYPQGTPSLTISTIGMFQVMITGEVPHSRAVNAWGLSRLSEIIYNSIGEYSSIRNITIEDNSGKRKTYDLFKGFYLGETGNNPLVRPGDTIIISRRGKEIELRGEIYRPGIYQIEKEDTISDIIRIYGGDFTEQANTEQIRIERTTNNTSEFISFTSSAQKSAESFIQNGDIIIVDPVAVQSPFVYIEGAVRPITDEAIEGIDPEAALAADTHNLIIQPYFIGDTLYDILNKMRDSFTTDADLVNSYILKKTTEEILPVNIQALLYENDTSQDLPIEPFDKIIIPNISHMVMVNGDVRNPGNYYYVPQKKYMYYIRRAGGTLNGNLEVNTIIIIDRDGNQKDAQNEIAFGDNIIVKQATVLITGAVENPGEYPYLYGKTYDYYVNLAGGINYERSNGSVRIKDNKNNKKDKSEIILPGDSIYVPSSSFTYNLSTVMNIITAALSIVISSFILYDRFNE